MHEWSLGISDTLGLGPQYLFNSPRQDAHFMILNEFIVQDNSIAVTRVTILWSEGKLIRMLIFHLSMAQAGYLFYNFGTASLGKGKE